MRWRCMNSLAKLLLDSSCAAAWVGPKTGQPRLWNSSTTPSVSGSSGPTTVRSGLSRPASWTSESRLLRSAATHSASAAIPPLPGAQYSFLTRGDCRSFQTIACSRPPLPRTRTFIGRIDARKEKSRGMVAAMSNGCSSELRARASSHEPRASSCEASAPFRFSWRAPGCRAAECSLDGSSSRRPL